MTDQPRSVGRSIIGRPRVWQGCVWLGVGLAWTVLALLESTSGLLGASRYALGGVFLVIGAAYLIVALRDRRRREGAYISPERVTQDASSGAGSD